jgi:hypothetical protein
MTKAGFHRHAAQRRKKNVIPLSKLRASEVVRTVVDHPRRLDELVDLLRDNERAIRGRAAATFTRLSETHPGRLVRHVEALRESLGDDAAYVRWHLLYALGRVIARFPRRASGSLADIKAHLTDEHKVARSFACRALEMIASSNPKLVHAIFTSEKEEIPPSLARLFKEAGLPVASPKSSS